MPEDVLSQAGSDALAKVEERERLVARVRR